VLADDAASGSAPRRSAASRAKLAYAAILPVERSPASERSISRHHVGS